ncbi:hypothetical protein L3Y21_gp099 [Gordonia phage Rabbitrun]|uniref:Uncharacterized protein n=1 Tax=Gordonia phage Rabbitrun TaxID=2762280 RepID=A0A7G8LIU5_9CAUD|nr:hypothetical protein L3Y21_gp099 [Gordonia phage Rabbitrun]QNJ57167.1 hypothetical protein SEA_RABBITRUN_137 [Gordonia phage Rabbitrun]
MTYTLATATTETTYATYEDARAAQLTHPERAGSSIIPN